MSITSSHRHVALTELSRLGTGLVRPECVVTHRSGYVFAADWDGSGGVSVIAPDGKVGRIMARWPVESPLRPNGIALEPGGTFLIAHLGQETGGLFRLYPDGQVETVLASIDGQPLPPSNFALVDSRGRIWLTVSTRISPRALDYRPSANTGFIVLIDQGRARIVADGLGYTNECALSADERHLFVNETFARRLTRYAITGDGSLSERTTVASFGIGTFPDGVVLDAQGGFWVTSIVSNRVIHVDPKGTQSIIIEESDAAHVATVEEAFQSNTMGRPHLDGAPSKILRNISSLCFGGPGMRRGYIGCLLGDTLLAADLDVPGSPHLTYNADISTLLQHMVTS